MKHLSLKSTEVDRLINVILLLHNRTEARKFLRDLLTEPEIIEFAHRWNAAQMLNQHYPYSEIKHKTGLSSTTIARISKWLKHGKGGYQIMLKHLQVK